MRIGIVMPLAEQRGGGELMLLHLIRQGRGMGAEWHIIFLKDGPMIGQIQELGVRTTLIPAGRMREVLRLGATVKHIATLIKSEKIDILVSWMATSHLYGGPAAKWAGIPALWYQLGVPKSDLLDLIATRLPAKAILTCSAAGAASQKQLRPTRPLYVVYPGVEIERFDPAVLPAPAQLRQTLGLPKTGSIIGIVGRLQRWKGMHILLQAMPRLLESHPDAHCVIVGGSHAPETDYPRFLEAEIDRLGIRTSVIMAGLQSNVQEWMNAMDIVVHASDFEPFGIVILEAMALGKPVIAGAAGGPCEIITDGENGLLVPYGSPDLLACALERLLDDPPFAEHIGRAAQRRAHDFSTERYAQNFLSTVQGLLASPLGALFYEH